MMVLVACEESQAVCAAFRSKGLEAYSCDLLECSGDYPEYHIMNDVLPLLNWNCEFTTMDGISHKFNYCLCYGRSMGMILFLTNGFD